MVIIIDAYNVLKYVYGAAYISEEQRDEFTTMLFNYGSNYQHTIFLVFDGGSFNHSSSIQDKVITIMYAGFHATADDLIIKLLSQQHHNNSLLISSDALLIKHAHKLSIATMDGSLFYHHLECYSHKKTNNLDTTKKVSDTPQKMVGYESSREIDELMMSIGIPMIKDDEIIKEKQSSARKESLRAKKLKRLAKKL